MHPERSSPGKRPQRWARRWAAMGGVALAAIMAGGMFALLVSGRDDARPLATEVSPTPTAAVQTPSPAASPSASPSASATPAQTPEPTATPAQGSDAGAWIGPELISTRDYGQLALVVDDGGVAHAAGTLDGAIYYLTNATGSWTREPIPAAQASGHPWATSIALDADGSLWIAFDATECHVSHEDGIGGCAPPATYLTTRASGTWSDAAKLLDGGEPSLQIRDGVLHLAYVARGSTSDVACDGPSPIRYATNVSGSWTDEQVASHGHGPLLELGSDGRARILFDDYGCRFLGGEGLWYATAATATGSFSVEGIPGTTPSDSRAVAMGLDASNTPHILFWRFPESELIDGYDAYYALRGHDGWHQPEKVPGADARAMAIDRRGAAHLVGIGEGGAWYASNASGSFDAEQLSSSGAPWTDSRAAIAVDAHGHPHILLAFTKLDAEGHPVTSELWYAIGPGD